MDIYYDWSIESMLEVRLPDPDAFLKVCETLTRIGIASKKDNTLYQSCHLLHKQGKYFLVHFKELFCLDGKESNITLNDIERRNAIANLLEEWGLITVMNPQIMVDNIAPIHQIKIISYREKDELELISKYNIGKKKTDY